MTEETIGILSVKLDRIEKDIAEIKACLNTKYVTIREFKPVRAIVYGLVGAGGLAVLAAIFKTVLK